MGGGRPLLCRGPFNGTAVHLSREIFESYETPAAESSAQPIGPGYESDASYISLPSSVIDTRTGVQLDVFLPHHWLGYTK
jgi:hypothetical protein